MSKKKEYENISAKMIEFHNNEVITFVRKYIGRPVKITRQRCIGLRDRLEEGNLRNWEANYSHDFTVEYLMLNSFLFNLLSEEEQNSCAELLKSRDTSNQMIGANILYNLIENKKQQIKEKLKE